MLKIDLFKNDKDYDLNFTLQNNDETVFDLTGATIKFNAQEVDDSELSVEGTMSIVLAGSGTCKYTVQEDDFDEAGEYYTEIEVTIGSQIITFGDILITAKNELPR